MATRAFLCFVVSVLLRPSHAGAMESVPADSRNPTRQALYALNALNMNGMSGAMREFFDAGLRRSGAFPGTPVPPLAKAHVAPPPAPTRVSPAPPPFSLRIPDVPPPAYERQFRRLLARGRDIDRYDGLIQEQAEQRGLDPRLVKAIIAAESNFGRRALSPTGAIGLMQLMPATAEECGAAAAWLLDPMANIRAGTLYLLRLFEKAWRRYHLKGVSFDKAPQWLVQRILAAYNAGPRFLGRHRLCRQTRAYIYKVLLLYRSAVTELRPLARGIRW